MCLDEAELSLMVKEREKISIQIKFRNSSQVNIQTASSFPSANKNNVMLMYSSSRQWLCCQPSWAMQYVSCLLVSLCPDKSYREIQQVNSNLVRLKNRQRCLLTATWNQKDSCVAHEHAFIFASVIWNFPLRTSPDNMRAWRHPRSHR